MTLISYEKTCSLESHHDSVVNFKDFRFTKVNEDTYHLDRN